MKIILVTINLLLFIYGFSFAQIEPQIYIVGQDGHDAAYWLNNRQYILPKINNTASALGIASLNNDIYIIGFDDNFGYNNQEFIDNNFGPVYYHTGDAVYWLNGVQNVLPKVNNKAIANAIKVIGSDVYIVGADSNILIDAWLGWDIRSQTGDAVYWLNGERNVLPKVNEFASANSIAISGSDVYIAGMDGNNPVYWLNGRQFILPQAGDIVNTSSIAIIGSDVYITGRTRVTRSARNADAVYWLNNRRFVLSSSLLANASAISISGSNIYITGNDNDAVYWLNGRRIVLPTVIAEPQYETGYTSQDRAANAISIIGSNIYIVGFNENNAILWLNGRRIVLPKRHSARANDILIK